MNRLLIPLIAIGILFAALAPISADADLGACTPDPHLEYQHYGDNQVEILFSPRLSIDCHLYDGISWGNPGNAIELQVYNLWVYHAERVGQTDEWVVNKVFHSSYNSVEIAGLTSAAPYYGLGGGVEITGASIGANHRYRVQVILHGRFSPYTLDEDFANFYEGEWIPGPDVIEVSGVFEERPGELSPATRSTHALDLDQPDSIKNKPR